MVHKDMLKVLKTTWNFYYIFTSYLNILLHWQVIGIPEKQNGLQEALKGDHHPT